jgi:N-acetyl-D-muramate 6-phosphate phosphatase
MTSKAATIKAVLFDLDGTLLDTAPDFEIVLNRLREEEGQPALSADDIRATVSNGAGALVTLGFGIDPQHQRFEPLRQRLLNHYSQHLSVKTKPFPGIEELLHQLHNRQLSWGVVTNKPDIYTQPLLRAQNLQPAPEAIICPDHVQQKKPAPEALHLACNHIGCQPHEAIYVGDHRRDIECGKNAGMTTIAAAYGYIHNRAEAESWQADHLVDNAEQIWPIIQRYL